MLISDPRLTVPFTDFGILIPIQPSKVLKVLDYLERLPALREQNWHISSINETINFADLARVHTPAYLERLQQPQLRQEILNCYELIDTRGQCHRWDPDSAILPLEDLFKIALLHAQGTLQACRIALKRGFCYFLGGGLHHAHADLPSGFCLINDLVIALRRLQAESQIQDAWIIDVDAHKGDGTASICQNDDSILTLSIHMGDAWPLDPSTKKSRGSNNPSLIDSDVDILQFKGEDDLYLNRLADGLIRMESLALQRRQRLPDLVIVVDGSDPYELDELPSTATLKLSLEQMLERDLLIDQFFRHRKIPATWVNAGGYGEAVWQVYTQFLERVLPGAC